MRVIVTRAEPGASDTASRLAALGHEALAAPMLAIRPLPAPVGLGGAQALLFTSSNGVRAFAAASAERGLPAFCVGDATAAASRDAGFAVVRSADGDLGALASLVSQELDAARGALIHIAGADLAGDLAGLLRARGFDVRVHTAYRAVPADALAPNVAAALDASPPTVDAVMFHSARGAAQFVALAKGRAGLDRITALCLSEAVAAAARAISWRQVHVAAAPRESELLALLGQADLRADSGQKDC